MAKPNGAGAKAKHQGGGALHLVGLGLAAGLLLSYALATGVLLLLGLVPGLLAWLLDTSPRRAMARTILFCNLAGLAPALAALWRSPQGFSGGFGMLVEWHTLGLAWAGAAAGLALGAMLPMLAVLVVDAQAAARRVALEKRRAELVEEWGDGGE